MTRQTALIETLQIILIGLAILLFIFFQFGPLNHHGAAVSMNETAASASGTGGDGLEIHTALNRGGDSVPFTRSP